MAPLARTHDPPAARPPGGPRALGWGAMGREDRGWAVEGARKGLFRIFPWPTVDAGLVGGGSNAEFKTKLRFFVRPTAFCPGMSRARFLKSPPSTHVASQESSAPSCSMSTGPLVFM